MVVLSIMQNLYLKVFDCITEYLWELKHSKILKDTSYSSSRTELSRLSRYKLEANLSKINNIKSLINDINKLLSLDDVDNFNVVINNYLNDTITDPRDIYKIEGFLMEVQTGKDIAKFLKSQGYISDYRVKFFTPTHEAQIAWHDLMERKLI